MSMTIINFIVMGRMGEALSEFSSNKFSLVEFHAFTSVKKACNWLGIKNPVKYETI